MKKKIVITICAASAIIIALLFHTHHQKAKPMPFVDTWMTMSTFASFTSYSTSIGQYEKEKQAVKSAFEAVEEHLSIFNPESDISVLNKNRSIVLPIKNSTNTVCDPLAVITYALQVARESGGAFDITINPLMKLWGFRSSTRTAERPSQDKLNAALALVDYKSIVLTTNTDNTVTIKLTKQGTEIDLGGIAKGYAVDLAYEKLCEIGAENFLINLGGNIRVHGSPNGERRFWRIGVRDGRKPEVIENTAYELKSSQAIATSGSYERYVEIDGKRYSHIIDPRTGNPVERTDSVSIVADSAMEADALSTAYFVIGKFSSEK